jgi:hypothetical protein
MARRPVGNRHLQAAGGEGAAIDDFAGGLGDVDEAAAADEPTVELANIDVAVARQSEIMAAGGNAAMRVSLVWRPTI